jgi:hypothetical protein
MIVEHILNIHKKGVCIQKDGSHEPLFFHCWTFPSVLWQPAGYWNGVLVLYSGVSWSRCGTQVYVAWWNHAWQVAFASQWCCHCPLMVQ